MKLTVDSLKETKLTRIGEKIADTFCAANLKPTEKIISETCKNNSLSSSIRNGTESASLTTAFIRDSESKNFNGSLVSYHYWEGNSAFQCHSIKNKQIRRLRRPAKLLIFRWNILPFSIDRFISNSSQQKTAEKFTCKNVSLLNSQLQMRLWFPYCSLTPIRLTQRLYKHWWMTIQITLFDLWHKNLKTTWLYSQNDKASPFGSNGSWLHEGIRSEANMHKAYH